MSSFVSIARSTHEQFLTGYRVVKRTLSTAFAVVVGVATGECAHANGVAICIAMDKNSSYLICTDLEYFLRHDGDPEKTGWDARRAARQAHDAKYGNRTKPPPPYCRGSGNHLVQGGRFVVIKGGRTKDALGGPYTRWALGFGSTAKEALDDALKVLSRRDRSWVEDEHGYSVVEQGSF